MTRKTQTPMRTWQWCERCEVNIDTALNHTHPNNDEHYTESETPTMAKKQQAFPGMDAERTDGERACDEKHDELVSVRAEIKAMKRKGIQLEVEQKMLMKAHKIRKRAYRDPEGVAREYEIGNEETVKSRKLPEPDVLDEARTPADPSGNGAPHAGLIKQAEQAQHDEANVEVDSEGNVVVPETSAKKRGRKAKN
jgi:hypothetical protein